MGREPKRGKRGIFRAGKTPKIPFLGLSVLANPTETLATQAKSSKEKKLDTAVFSAAVFLS